MVQRDGGYPEILFIRRAKRAGDPWSGDMAFPGGRNEEGENDQDTVAREVMEEVGLDLNTNGFVKLGCLNDREITSLLGGKPFMILSTFGKYLYLDKREWWRAVVQHQLRYTK
ncbi:unnamed protein product [Umbelopsis sp. WA50703]